MKRTGYLAAGILLVLGTMAASAQSLGDYARSVRKTKAPAQASASHHYDNENLPRDQQLNVVGPPPSATASEQAANSAQPTPASTAGATPGTATAKDPKDAKSAGDDRKKAAEEMQKKIAEQKQKVDALNHELDLTQREYKLRAAEFYSDAGARLRNPGQWDKDDAQYKQQIADKQKALEAARAELDATQEAARKAGIRQKDDQ